MLVYILFVILIASSGMIEEFALGRWAEAGPVGAFAKCTEERYGNRRIGGAVGALPVIGAMGLAIGYTVVMGWIFKYCFMGISGELYAMGTDMAVIGGTFDRAAPGAETLGKAIRMMIGGGIFGIGNSVWQLVGLAVAAVIMAMGVSGGIEKANKMMMPVLFGLFVILGIYIAFLPGAGEGYQYIFTLDLKGAGRPSGMDLCFWAGVFLVVCCRKRIGYLRFLSGSKGRSSGGGEKRGNLRFNCCNAGSFGYFAGNGGRWRNAGCSRSGAYVHIPRQCTERYGRWAHCGNDFLYLRFVCRCNIHHESV